jgi:hypothetical protein
VETERLRQSRNRGERLSRNYTLERQKELLVLPSEIAGLSALCGYLKVGNGVTTLRLPYVSLPAVAPDFVERAEVTPLPRPVRPPAAHTPCGGAIDAGGVRARHRLPVRRVFVKPPRTCPAQLVVEPKTASGMPRSDR